LREQLSDTAAAPEHGPPHALSQRPERDRRDAAALLPLLRGEPLTARTSAVLLLAAWLGGCATPARSLPPGARAVYAFDVETYLGRRFSGYGTTEETCRARRDVEIAHQTTSAPARFPFYRTTVLTRCYPAALAEGGYSWAVEADGAWGAVMPTGALCDAMRETLAPSVPASGLGPCAPVTLTPR